MANKILTGVFVVFTTTVNAQFSEKHSSDSSNTSSVSRFSEFGSEKRIVGKDHVLLWTTNLVLSIPENTVLDLEERECLALLKHDTSELRELWSRDFTIDRPANEVMVSVNPLPFYVSMHRMIEQLWASDHNFISVTGEETVQLLKSNGTPAPSEKRKFRHIWSNQRGTWKLTSRSMTD
jgi:hypothetical protein